MKNKSILIFLVTIILTLFTALAYSAQPAKLAIIPFKVDNADVLGYIRDGIWNMLASRIAKKENISVLGKIQVKKALEEFNFQVTESTAQKLGLKLGADYVVFGEITGPTEEINLGITMLDVGKEKIIISTRSSTDLNEVIPKIWEFAANINRGIEGIPVLASYKPAVLPPPLPSPPPPEPEKFPEEIEPKIDEGEKPLAYDDEKVPINLEADTLSYDQNTEISIASGNVKITKGEMVLKADTIRFNSETEDVTAKGNVAFSRNKDRLTSREMKLNLDTEKGIIYDGSIFFQKENVYVQGTRIEKLGEESYRITEGSITTCDGDTPDWNINAGKMDITVGGYARIKDMTFNIKDYPVFYFPYFIYPIKTERQTGFLIPKIGYSSDDGVEFDLPFFWAISPHMDATFRQHILSKRGLKEGFEFRYAMNNDSRGKLNLEYINDRKVENDTDYGDYHRTKRNRWLVQFEHDQYFSPGFFTKADVNLISDNDYYRDFDTNVDLRTERYLESKWSLTKNWERFSFLTECQYFDDIDKKNNDETLQYLPRISFDALNQQIGAWPLFFNLNSSYENLWREKGMTGHRLDLYPQVFLPLKFGDFLEVVPRVGMRETAYWFEDDAKRREEEHREIYDLSLKISTVLSRIFDVNGSRISKLKHLIEPGIEYIYVPFIDQDYLPYNSLSTKIFEQRTIAYSLNNTLIGKMIGAGGEHAYQELVDFNLRHSYNFRSAKYSISGKERRYFSDIEGDLKIKLSNNIYLDFDARYDIYEDWFNEKNVALNLKDNRGDSFYFDYRYQRDLDGKVEIESLNTKLKFRATDYLDFTYYSRYSLTDDIFLESIYGIDYRSQCWSVLLTYTERPGYQGDERENKFMAIFSLYGLGPIISLGS